MTQRKVIVRGATNQALDELEATDIPDLSATYDVAGAAAARAPADVDYLVGTASAGLSAEIAVGTSPGGELGGTWASPTVDATHAGSSHIALSASEPGAVSTTSSGTAGTGTAASKDDHAHDLGFDDATADPAAIGTTADGTATSAARKDHVHATGAGTPSTQAFGDSAAVGTGPAAAMTDHKHAMPADPSGSLIAKSFLDAKGDLISASADNTPAIVTVGANDTILMADSAAAAGLKWVASATPSTQAFGDAAAVGTSDTFTRGDHKHAMPADPTTALTGLDFLVGTATGALSAEIVAGTTPGGELGGTWASPTVDPNHGGEYLLIGGDITIADTYTTIASQAITFAAGQGLLVECSGLVLNNSGSARTYTIALDINGVLCEISNGATIAASATNHSPIDFTGGISVQSTSLTYMWARALFFGPGAANTATTMAGLSSIRGTWNSSATNLTGAQTILVKIKSSNVASTQTLHRMVSRMRLV